MKKIVHINAWGNGSTGKLIDKLKKESMERGMDAVSIYGRGESATPETSFYVNSKPNLYADALLSRLLDNQGHNSIQSTNRVIALLEVYKPDLIHIHNLHGYWMNYKKLFAYIVAKDIPVVWTFHDCWPLTGHCTSYEYLGCNNRLIGCGHCPGRSIYPKALLDHSKRNYRNKQSVFTSVNRMHIVTPSDWLARLVKNSYMNRYPVTVIHNEIDHGVFRPCEYEYLYNKYKIPRGKKIVLYVGMNTLDPWKGFNLLMDAAKLLPEEYHVVIVGDCKIERTEQILNIGRTENQQELAAFYSMADVLANPALDDNYPTVNIEALSCGLPVVAFYTGGIPEQVDPTVGALCSKKDPKTLAEAICAVCENGKTLYSENCLAKADLLSGRGEYIEAYWNIYQEWLNE